jgi:RNA polymerase sigma-70 factor (ECF subfamily)
LETEHLVRLCKNGHNQYYEKLIEYYEKTLYKYCYYLTQNSVETDDLYQETWIKVISKIHSYDDKYEFKNWLLMIATNTYRDNYRKVKRWSEKVFTLKSDSLENLNDTNKTPVEIMEEHERYNQLRVEVGKLKDHYKIVIILHYFEELKINEISEVLGIPKGTVKSRLNQARKILKSKVGDTYED